MQFIQSTREALLKPLQIVGGIVEGRQTLPILSNILVNANGSEVTFTTTDLEIQIRTSAQIGVGTDPVTVTVPAAKLIALLTALPSASTEVSMLTEGKKVMLRANNSRFTLSQMAAEEYPVLPVAEIDYTFSLPANVLKHLMQMVHFAMAQQDIRYYLNGMLLSIDKGLVRAVATDGHRLACCDAPLEIETGVESPIEAILPRKTVHQLMKLLPDTDDPVKLEVSKTQARFTFGNIEFLTKLVDGKYPDYNRVIPQNNDKIFLINREELIGANGRMRPWIQN